MLDTREFKLVQAFSPTQVQANCGTILSPDGQHMYLVGGERRACGTRWIRARTRQPTEANQVGMMRTARASPLTAASTGW